jgi:nicotinate-nucleotide--dimethylbenzimidazole phosphoribosyltransferase
VDDLGLERKIKAIETGIQINQPDPSDPLDVLAKVGGFEIGGLAGLVIGAAAHSIPVVCDGLISTAGAMLACEISPPQENTFLPATIQLNPVIASCWIILSLNLYWI